VLLGSRGRGATHRPQAAGPLFIFRAAGPRPTGSTAAAPTTAGTGTRRLPADRVMPRRFHHTPAAAAALPLS